MDIEVDYQLLAEAIDFYQKIGYKYIHVDWSVSKVAIDITKPLQGLVSPAPEINNKFLVASAEQSFLQKILENELPPGKYVTCSPCFRVNEHDETHRPYFMKVELIHFLGDEFDKVNLELFSCLNNALDFFKLKLEDVYFQEMASDQIDIMHNNIELGSYGIRHDSKIGFWVYGTGCAEPRLSHCIKTE